MTASEPDLTARRTGTRQYVAKNSRGGQLTIGYGDGEFTPGDLLKLALLGCSLLSGEARFTAKLGEDTLLEGDISAEYVQTDNRFSEFTVNIQSEMDELPEEQRSALIKRVEKAIERNCTISHTVSRGAPTHLNFLGDAV